MRVLCLLQLSQSITFDDHRVLDSSLIILLLGTQDISSYELANLLNFFGPLPLQERPTSPTGLTSASPVT